jgi:hypothetical protein
MINKILPYKKYTLNSSLSKEEVVVNLKSSIDFEKSFGFGGANIKYSKPYVGIVYGNLFEMKRVIDYRNAFIPQIKGEIVENKEGVIINIEIKLLGYVQAFLLVWFGFCLFFSSIILILAIFKENINVSMVFFLLFMFVMGSTIVYSGFESEADTTKRDLEKILCVKK